MQQLRSFRIQGMHWQQSKPFLVKGLPSGTITLFLDSPDGQSEQVGIFTDQDIMRSAGVGPNQKTYKFAAETCFVNVEHLPRRWNIEQNIPYSDLFSPDFR